MIFLSVMLISACAQAPEPEPEAAPEPQFDQAAEEAAIREVVEQAYAALNKHDVKAAFALCDDNFENFSGTRKGRAANEEAWAEIFATRFKNVEYSQYEEIGIQFITPDVAIYKDRYDFSGALGTDGEPRPPTKSSNGWVFVKKDGRWLMATIIQWVIPE